MNDPYRTETIEKDGASYRVQWHYDYDSGPPEENCDGHGIVVRLGSDPKDFDPEELTITEAAVNMMMRRLSPHTRNNNDAYYNVFDTIEKARKEGWGMGKEWHDAHPEATPDEVLMAAVEADFTYISRWYNDDWHYCGITVTHLATGNYESLWGLESNDTEHHKEVIEDLMHEANPMGLRASTEEERVAMRAKGYHVEDSALARADQQIQVWVPLSD